MSPRPRPAPEAPPSESGCLTIALRAIRRRRGVRAQDVAKAMGLALRTYQYFEAGGVQLDWTRIKSFATATDSDAYAILLAIALGSPDFAVRCMDNKLATILVAAIRRFDDRLEDRLSRIEVGRLIAAFRRMFAELEADLIAQESQAQAWLRDEDSTS